MMLLTVTGFLGCDVEEKHTKAGIPYRRFVIGVSGRKNRDEETQWVECQMWDNRFAALFPYLFKGSLVLVIGRVQVSAYLSRLQLPKAQLRVSVESLNFLPQAKRPDRIVLDEGEAPSVNILRPAPEKEGEEEEERGEEGKEEDSLWEEEDEGIPIF